MKSVTKPKFFKGLAVVLALTAGTAASQDGEFVPIPVGEDHVGILRFTAADDVSEVWLAVGTRSDDPGRPIETYAGDIGPYSGPEVAIFVPYVASSQLPFEQIAFELYQRDPYRRVGLFAPVTDAENAESAEDCGTISRLGECENR